MGTALSSSQNTGVFGILDRILDGIGRTAGDVVSAVGQIVPAAAGAVANAAGDAVSGINGAVSDFSAGISAPAPAASNPFAGLDLGGALEGLRSCSMNNSLSCELGDMTAQLANMSMQRQGASMSV